MGRAWGPPFVFLLSGSAGGFGRLYAIFHGGAVYLEQRIEEIIGPTLEDMGFEVVRVLLSGDQRLKLQIMAEPLDGRMMTVDHCADISRAVSALLDVEDPIDRAYTLEVSSPGIDRPLVKPRDFERFAGFEARVEMDQAIDGRRRFKGRLQGYADDQIVIDVEGMETRLPFSDMRRAKLLLTDELIAAHQAAEDAATEAVDD